MHTGSTYLNAMQIIYVTKRRTSSGMSNIAVEGGPKDAIRTSEMVRRESVVLPSVLYTIKCAIVRYFGHMSFQTCQCMLYEYVVYVSQFCTREMGLCPAIHWNERTDERTSFVLLDSWHTAQLTAIVPIYSQAFGLARFK